MVIFDGGRCPGGGQMSYCFTLRRRTRQGNREDDVEDIIRTARSEHAAMAFRIGSQRLITIKMTRQSTSKQLPRN